ncbi:MAG: cupin 2 conserved barrel protein [uncultured bacterium]|nr:MAG: cupin 2 conserved barrel protein [uncultured bacterium]OGT23527.1 MAG: hypothetical protein A2W47_04590 [Gammaproteobacteria bacterium RIFCSPHIGHO2_12_38_15]OGT69277.1 MAG: hypothetical protein A3I12_01160 [Gammaproteobacteria bacterium RIFCSPLOWO2_02_FULL_38_11]OGT77383.1 MAG: hypothetical protein A3G71_03205 [Gammaproteobacteria bacterium RIFCSPLOWO2_12_FULL_38_14]
MKTFFSTTTLLFILGITTASAIPLENAMTHSKPVEINTILDTNKSWAGTLLPGFSAGQTAFKVLTFKISPGAKTSIHVHPLNGAGYILSGELTMYSTEDTHGSFANPKQVKKIILKAGDAWTETVNTWHYGENNGSQDVKFIVVFAGQEGTPPTLTLELPTKK